LRASGSPDVHVASLRVGPGNRLQQVDLSMPEFPSYPPLLFLGFFFLMNEAAKRPRKCHVRHACYLLVGINLIMG
jgi:hypothetical protein